MKTLKLMQKEHHLLQKGDFSWEKLKKKPDMIKHSFLKCGFFNNLDGTEHYQIKTRGIEDYTMPFTEMEFTLLEDDKESGSDSD